MKFDLFAWEEVTTNETIFFGKGRLLLQLSALAPLYVEAEGVESLAGFAAFHDIETTEEISFRVDAPEGVRAFIKRPVVTAVEAEGETYTNADRMPHESGIMADVTRARRQLEIERRNMLRDIRVEAAKARASFRQADAGEVPQLGGVSGETPAAAETEGEAK